ncbi:MAG: dihydroorotate dehydrogenase [Spirochaetales bacterium]|jgi:dihydroorotate dehydrogenase (NAD+) catalytic subunit|nr:dihydroorotate dehydrogenase [Spirochaetales bacterium]
MVSLRTRFLGRELSSPLVLPAGILGMSYGSLRFACDAGFGLVTSKSLSLEPRRGHEGPIVARFGGGIINSLGLCNPGIAAGLKEVDEFSAVSGSPVMVSVFAVNRGDFEELVRRACDSSAAFIELNLSCPNVMDEFGIPLAASKELVADIVEGAKKASRLPVIAKLSPNALELPAIARAAQEAGADALSLINTLGPGLLIDTAVRRPILAPCFGGISGPAVFPLALKLVYECTGRVSIPVIGMGGVSTGDEAVQMFMAGASLVGVGTAVWLSGAGVVAEIAKGIWEYLEREGFSSVMNLPKLERGNG